MAYFTAFTPFRFWMKSQEMKKWKNGSMFVDPVSGRKFQTSLYWVQAIPLVLNRLLFVGESWVWAQKEIWKGSKLNDNFCQLQATREERKVLYQQLLESKIQRAKLCLPLLHAHCGTWATSGQAACMILHLTEILSLLAHKGARNDSQQYCSEWKPSIMCRREAGGLWKVLAL